jgi:leucyl-tRNA synthetase
MVYCENCGEVPVPEKDLPVVLPEDVEFKPTGESPLKSDANFVNTTCPKCGGAAKRETDTMDTFVCSSWYYFRYTDPRNDKEFASKKNIETWMPVDMYVGGAEHSVLHLLYSRFFTKALKDHGYVDFSEPFMTLRHQGMILGPNGLKMSKSKGNVVSPDEWVEKVGSDTVRMYLGFMGPYDQGGPWNPSSVMGVKRFLDKAWGLYQGKIEDTEADLEEVRLVNQTLKKVGEDIENFRFNTAISALMVIVNQLAKNKVQHRRSIELLALMLAPFAPFVTEEIWSSLGFKESIHLETWPSYDEKYLESELATIVVQVNGKVRANLEMSKNSTQEEAEKLARENANVKKFLADSEVKKVIFVPNKLLNFVV